MHRITKANKTAYTVRSFFLMFSSLSLTRCRVSFFINNIEAKKFASQGQQRTIVLSLKLAELELIKEKIDDIPVLLLDDVLAELDNIRQNYLLNAIGSETQTIITSVDTLQFDEEYLKDVEIFKISDGTLVK